MEYEEEGPGRVSPRRFLMILSHSKSVCLLLSSALVVYRA